MAITDTSGPATRPGGTTVPPGQPAAQGVSADDQGAAHAAPFVEAR
jgi:hypothetical protein